MEDSRGSDKQTESSKKKNMITAPFTRGPLVSSRGEAVNKLLIICGPTATGKTDLAILLAKKFKGEIVSADSRQVYKGMDIGTGKDIDTNSKFKIQNSKLQIKNKNLFVGSRLKNNIPIWLVDIVDPDYRFNAGEYRSLAQKVISDIWLRKKLPIVVGGTGLYIKSIIEPLFFMKIPPDRFLRHLLEKLTREELAVYLQQIDREKFNTMNNSDRLNPRRLIRAIEIAKQMPKLKLLMENNRKLPNKDTLMIGLNTSNEVLFRQIDKRVNKRVKYGMEKEVKKLLRDGFAWANSAMRVTIGYKQWQDYFTHAKTKEEAIKEWQYAEHAYVRRQKTWFRKQKQIKWFDIKEKDYITKIEKIINKWYTLR